jgi:site-specific DNA recombinase
MNKPNNNHRLNCAIYTRKSTDEGLDKEFNSLDAQRECAEAYIKSQTQEGWNCLPDHYDDGGFTGGNMDRPALKQLLADIEAGKVNCVVVYKVDRLSRSLMDFAKMLEVFERNQIAFVSVTQQFNTTNSMGRLMLNVLLSFAQFEREIISERTRDKIAAARRKGKWSGGMPLLGYDIDPQGGKLRVNEVEANRVRKIYDLYIDRESIMATIAELDNRSWNNKSWNTKKGILRGGSPFTKATLFRLLTNVTYIGKLAYKDEINEGEHDPIVTPDVWQRVQSLLRRNGRTGGVDARNKFGALLKGILRCSCCDCSMTPTHTTKSGAKRYRYYVCMKAQKRGRRICESKSVPAAEIEKFVVDKIRQVVENERLVDEVVQQAKVQTQHELDALVAERDEIVKEIEYWNEAIRIAAPKIKPNSPDANLLKQLADWHEDLRIAENRLTVVNAKLTLLKSQALTSNDVATALDSFEPVWESLATTNLTNEDRDDLVQEAYAQVTKSLESFDPAVGHIRPFIVTVVQRHLGNVVRDRNVAKRATRGRVSLSKTVRSEEDAHVEMSQVLHDKDQDRRLGRERRLSDEELNDLRLDLAAFMKTLPERFQDLLRRRQTQTISEISRDLGVPRTTVNDWMRKIQSLFEDAGFDRYLDE